MQSWLHAQAKAREQRIQRGDEVDEEGERKRRRERGTQPRFGYCRGGGHKLEMMWPLWLAGTATSAGDRQEASQEASQEVPASHLANPAGGQVTGVAKNKELQR